MLHKYLNLVYVVSSYVRIWVFKISVKDLLQHHFYCSVATHMKAYLHASAHVSKGA